MDSINRNELFRRQKDLFNPDSFGRELTVHIFGCGSIGSFTAIAVSKLGIHNVILWDYDEVEQHNVSNQFFRQQDVGSSKTFAVDNLAREFAPTVTTITRPEKVTEQTDLRLQDGDIIILAFDNLPARKIVYDKAIASGKKVHLIDARMGGELLRIYIRKNLVHDEYYEKSLTTEVEQVSCSARSICYNGITMAGLISSIVKKIFLEQEIPYEINFSLTNYDFVKVWFLWPKLN